MIRLQSVQQYDFFFAKLQYFLRTFIAICGAIQSVVSTTFPIFVFLLWWKASLN